MSKYSFYALIIATLCLSACASRHTAAHQPVKNTKVIVVAKNGAVTVDRKPVRLRSLVTTLKAQGVTKDSRLAVEGDHGANQKAIDRVMEMLADGGLLPKGTID